MSLNFILTLDNLCQSKCSTFTMLPIKTSFSSSLMHVLHYSLGPFGQEIDSSQIKIRKLRMSIYLRLSAGSEGDKGFIFFKV